MSETMITEKLKGKDLEDRCLEFARDLSDLYLNRYGVIANHVGLLSESGRPLRDRNGRQITKIVPTPSLPDFEATMTANGFPFQFVFDCKVCSSSSLSLAKYEDARSVLTRQRTHMLKKSLLGVPCGFLIHFNSRALSTHDTEPETWWFPVEYNDFWNRVLALSIRSIRPSDCQVWGRPVRWVKKKGGTKLRPDLAHLFRGILTDLYDIEW